MTDKQHELMSALSEIKAEVHAKLDIQRKTVEQIQASLPADTAVKLDKLFKSLDEHEVKNKELCATLDKLNQEREAEIKRLEDLEKRLAQPVKGGSDEAEQKQAMQNVFKKMVHNMVQGIPHTTPHALEGLSETEKKYYRTDSVVNGGVFVTPDIETEVRKLLRDYGNFRSLARSVTLSKGDTYRQNVQTGKATASWSAQGLPMPLTEGTYGAEEIRVQPLVTATSTTLEAMEDPDVSMQQLWTEDAVEAFAEAESLAFLLGNGAGQPQGLLTASGITIVNSGVAADLDANSLYQLPAQLILPVMRDPRFLMNRTTARRLYLLKDGIGGSLWVAGNLAAGIPSLIAGYPFTEVAEMPNVGAGTIPITFGDFRQAYTVVDRMGISLHREDKVVTDGKIYIGWRKRVGGNVNRTNAVVHYRAQA
jgi:HK97 family phage major capsid protein